VRGEEFEERFRAEFHRSFPQVQWSFEAGDILSQVMSFGSPTPVEVAVQGPNLAADRGHIEKIRKELAKIPCLRDLRMPTLSIKPILRPR
jgi:hypothetical protein